MQAERRLYSVEEVSKCLGISSVTVHRLLRTGELRSVRVRRRLLIPSTEIDRLTNEGLGSAKALKDGEAGNSGVRR